MSASLKQLVKVAPPPSPPVAASGPEEWPSIEEKLGARLPRDYKEYIGIYGAGRWADFFGIMDPFYECEHPKAVAYFKWIQSALGGLNEMHDTFPQYAPPFRRHPASGGLLPIGYTDNGGTICWQTDGEADGWSIVCLAGKYVDGYDQYKMTLTGFLCALMTKKISPRTFPRDFFPIPQPPFRPYATE